MNLVYNHSINITSATRKLPKKVHTKITKKEAKNTQRKKSTRKKMPPSTGTTHPSTGTTHPSTGTTQPSTGTTHPSTGTTHPSTDKKRRPESKTTESSTDKKGAIPFMTKNPVKSEGSRERRVLRMREGTVDGCILNGCQTLI